MRKKGCSCKCHEGITTERLHQLLLYKDGSLYWREGRKRRAGYTGNNRVRSIYIDGKYYSEHRLVWQLFKGAIPEAMVIDHIDHDSLNNKIENLRLATRAQNQRNMRLFKTNTTGHAGVRYLPKRSRWNARIQVDRRNLFLGNFLKKEDAIAARKAAERKYDFHPNHGAKVAA